MHLIFLSMLKDWMWKEILEVKTLVIEFDLTNLEIVCLQEHKLCKEKVVSLGGKFDQMPMCE